MFFLKKVGCRVFQGFFRLLMPFLPYREPEILFSCDDLLMVLEKEKCQAVLVVSDATIIKNNLVAPILKVLKESRIKYVTYDKTSLNPTTNNVEDALKLYHQHHCNLIIAIGGGSPIDCAKAVGARVAYPKKSLNQLRGILKVNRKIPPLIAIPTTAGTGSETTLAAIITDSETRHKYALMSFPLIPRYAVLDPKFTYSLPAIMTATTGMDALTHAVEVYIGRASTRETRKLAKEAIKLVFHNVEKAYQDGNEHQARANMLHAAYKAGLAFSKSYVGYIHAIAHSLGGRYGTPHGLANAVIMPYVLKSYGKCINKKLYQLALEVDIVAKGDSYEMGAKKFIKAIEELNTRMNIPRIITGISEADIIEMARYAEKEANPLYPVPKLMTKEELARLYYQVGGLIYQGETK
ncbi:MAG: iron-containing alcohol dehydrogenase [Erysipelotrichaceae bacterium]|jgi:alcohol dehydrogenase class IV|nr:iron-containing alcohol dehydrogenase [Erysipelotrichaceae bacterium]